MASGQCGDRVHLFCHLCASGEQGLRCRLMLCVMLDWLTSTQRQGDAAAAAAWQGLCDYAAANRLHMLGIDSVYLNGRTGSKAIVYLFGQPGYRRDAWFWHARVQLGSVVAVHLSQGWGPHTGRDDVLYVGSEHRGSGIYAVVDAQAVKRVLRHSRTPANVRG